MVQRMRRFKPTRVPIAVIEVGTVFMLLIAVGIVCFACGSIASGIGPMGPGAADCPQVYLTPLQGRVVSWQTGEAIPDAEVVLHVIEDPIDCYPSPVFPEPIPDQRLITDEQGVFRSDPISITEVNSIVYAISAPDCSLELEYTGIPAFFFFRDDGYTIRVSTCQS